MVSESDWLYFESANILYDADSYFFILIEN